MLKVNDKVLINIHEVKKENLLSMIANNFKYEIQLIKFFL